MSQELLIPTSQLPSVGMNGDFASRCHALLIQQKLTWELLRGNYASLEQVRTRTMAFDGFNIRLQYNPRRITSSAAKVDEESVKQRRCFLCPAHLPRNQRALPFEDGYLILCNPFPIFPEHFTIPNGQHLPQLLNGSFATMLRLSEAMGSRYTLFYNGPKCGASAPDHVHFQAGTRDLMPLDWEYPAIKARNGSALIESEAGSAYSISCLRHFFSLESADEGWLQQAYQVVYRSLSDGGADGEEPMINVLCSYQNEQWRVIVFPRAKHRPNFFFAQGDDQILLSPAAVDLGGLCITPVERDFERLTADHLTQMFQEVCLPQ